MAGSKASIPANRFYSPVNFQQDVTFDTGILVGQLATFLEGIDSTMSAAGHPALRMHGANLIGQLMEGLDFFDNPIVASNTDGLSVGAFGDRVGAYPPGDVFNAAFRTLTNAADNISVNAAAFEFGHGTSQSRVIAIGTGVPSAVFPRTSGVLPNGSFYFNETGGIGTTIYKVNGGAYAAIL